MRKALTTAALVIATASVVSGSYARSNDDEPMTFSWTAQEICLVGHPGTFTPGGDMTDFFAQIPAWGAGMITFHPAASTARDKGNWMFFLPQSFLTQPPGTPQNVFPARTSVGECTLTYQPGDGLSFTLKAPRIGCSATDTSGPNQGVKTTFTNGPETRGQFAADMQSFVAHHNELGSQDKFVIETGSDTNGGQFERICMRAIQGVRLPSNKR